MKLDLLPFHIGASSSFHNPDGLPDTLPFYFGFDPSKSALTQHSTPALLDVLERAYRSGQMIGTPLAEDRFGKPYADDLLSFISGHTSQSKGTALEIGAGVGYMTRRLVEAGWQAKGIEPGEGYATHWARYQVDIVNEFFPNVQTPGPFDLICSFFVLEHIVDPLTFLVSVREKLSLGGSAVFCVPDCTDEIAAGDPSMLVHEHFTFFNTETLTELLCRAGFRAVVQKSGYGRGLYAAAQRQQEMRLTTNRCDLSLLESYPRRAEYFIKKMRELLAKLAAAGTLGIYCPVRALAILDPTIPMRFFDDDKAHHGKFLPPFPVPIEGREALLARPVESLLVMSRTFGGKIKAGLLQDGYQGNVIVLTEFSF